jgi:hypothetical protein
MYLVCVYLFMYVRIYLSTIHYVFIFYVCLYVSICVCIYVCVCMHACMYVLSPSLTTQLLTIPLKPGHRKNSVVTVAVYQSVSHFTKHCQGGTIWPFLSAKFFFTIFAFAVSCSGNDYESCCIYIAVMSVCADVWLLPVQKIRHEIIAKFQSITRCYTFRNGKHFLTFQSYHHSSKCH